MPKRRGPLAGSEKETLRVSLDSHREIVLWKLDGLDDERLRRPMTPSGTNLLGLVKHLGSVEYGWFCGTFGRESHAIPFDENDPEADMRAGPNETTAEIVDYYKRACADANRVMEEIDLTDTGTAWSGETVSLRWVIVHMIEETARHAGHMDIIRELLDGTTGYLPVKEPQE
jgi:hypothetical protein